MNNIPHVVDTGASVMNNEPVAWMSNGKEFYVQKNCCPDFVPLYTHPSEHDLGIAEAIGFDKGYKAATAKTLTDEEIIKIVVREFGQHYCDNYYDSEWIYFARAILRKAQSD
jgi:hypothetical protein